MKFATLAALAAAAFTAVVASSASAQPQQAPQGSYRQSCTDIRVSNQGRDRTLSARCRTANGGQKQTSLRYDNCRGDIGNRNGDLFCETGGGNGGGSGQLPAGSYKQSCTQAYMSGYTLVATCRTSNGGQNRSSLDTRECRGREIANDNGRLVCTGNGNGGGGGGNAPIPDGSYKQSCNNLAMSGTVLFANCRDSRGQVARTSLDTRDCRGRDIANNNGKLVCTGSGGGGGGSAYPMPNGSFKQSCERAEMRAWTLDAWCRDNRGQLRHTNIDVRTCTGKDIGNIDGQLSCASTYPMPRGSYQQSCTNAQMRAWTLDAWCRDSRGQSRHTNLDVRPCQGKDIANVNGQLTCTGGGQGGGNRSSITLCTQPNFGGRCETIDGSAASLGRWEIANKAQSARVRGSWDVCDQQDFRGRCTRVDRDVSDLGRIGFNKRISSVRPR